MTWLASTVSRSEKTLTPLEFCFIKRTGDDRCSASPSLAPKRTASSERHLFPSSFNSNIEIKSTYIDNVGTTTQTRAASRGTRLPNGRASKPAAKAPKAATVPLVLLSCEKNILLKTSAAAAAYIIGLPVASDRDSPMHQLPTGDIRPSGAAAPASTSGGGCLIFPHLWLFSTKCPPQSSIPDCGAGENRRDAQ
jgi:hypothetical protein